jgi:hypothetical protein
MMLTSCTIVEEKQNDIVKFRQESSTTSSHLVTRLEELSMSNVPIEGTEYWKTDYLNMKILRSMHSIQPLECIIGTHVLTYGWMIKNSTSHNSIL